MFRTPFAPRTLSLALGVALLMPACKTSDPDADGTEGGAEDGIAEGVTSGTSASSADASESGTAESTTLDSTTTGDGDGDSSGDTSSGDTGPMECGNGIVEGTEECDDGPTGSSVCSEDCKYKTECSGTVWQCGDGIDNDEDGFIDNQDSDCFGPCDDNEGGWKGMIPGQNDNCQVDCYFDDDNGNGSDLCKWSFACDPLEPMNPPDDSCVYVDADNDGWGDENVSGAPGDSNTCEGLFTPMMPGQHPDCWDPDGSQGGDNTCGALTPPGCDCFGCCAIPKGTCTTDADCAGEGGECDTDSGLCFYTVYLGSQNTSNPNDTGSCNNDELTNPANCHPCTQVEACLNECVPEQCELCFGQTIDDLPDDCFEQECDNGADPCETAADCPEPLGYWACIANCCVPTPP